MCNMDLDCVIHCQCYKHMPPQNYLLVHSCHLRAGVPKSRTTHVKYPGPCVSMVRCAKLKLDFLIQEKHPKGIIKPFPLGQGEPEH